jgi:hypothetical protein
MKKKIKNLYPPHLDLLSSKHSDGKGGMITVLPSPIVRKNLTDYAYGKDIDEKVVTMAVALAEKMAINIIRETLNQQLDGVIEQVVEKLTAALIEKLPAQQIIIKEASSSNLPELKKQAKQMDFGGAIPTVNRTSGMTLKGKSGTISKTEDTTDDALDVLDKLNI